MKPDTIIPQALELEKSVIGAMLLEPEAITEVITILTPACFYDLILGKAYGVIAGMEFLTLPAQRVKII